MDFHKRIIVFQLLAYPHYGSACTYTCYKSICGKTFVFQLQRNLFTCSQLVRLRIKFIFKLTRKKYTSRSSQFFTQPNTSQKTALLLADELNIRRSEEHTSELQS